MDGAKVINDKTTQNPSLSLHNTVGAVMYDQYRSCPQIQGQLYLVCCRFPYANVGPE